jgi:hypothetical protein
MHNVLRAELVKMKACVDKVAGAPLQAWQVACLQKYWAGHTRAVHAHHDHKYTVFIPILEEHVTLP